MCCADSVELEAPGTTLCKRLALRCVCSGTDRCRRLALRRGRSSAGRWKRLALRCVSARHYVVSVPVPTGGSAWHNEVSILPAGGSAWHYVVSGPVPTGGSAWHYVV